jgi:hypothetical protein
VHVCFLGDPCYYVRSDRYIQYCSATAVPSRSRPIWREIFANGRSRRLLRSLQPARRPLMKSRTSIVFAGHAPAILGGRMLPMATHRSNPPAWAAFPWFVSCSGGLDITVELLTPAFCRPSANSKSSSPFAKLHRWSRQQRARRSSRHS